MRRDWGEEHTASKLPTTRRTRSGDLGQAVDAAPGMTRPSLGVGGDHGAVEGADQGIAWRPVEKVGEGRPPHRRTVGIGFRLRVEQRDQLSKRWRPLVLVGCLVTAKLAGSRAHQDAAGDALGVADAELLGHEALVGVAEDRKPVESEVVGPFGASSASCSIVSVSVGGRPDLPFPRRSNTQAGGSGQSSSVLPEQAVGDSVQHSAISRQPSVSHSPPAPVEQFYAELRTCSRRCHGQTFVEHGTPERHACDERCNRFELVRADLVATTGQISWPPPGNSHVP
jgi:hypothetical protein